MANNVSASGHSVFGTIDTTGASSSIQVNAARLVDLSLDFDSDTFVGTVLLERETKTGAGGIGEWQTISSYTASAEITFRSACTRKYRINVTVSSGTLRFEMTAGNKEGN